MKNIVSLLVMAMALVVMPMLSSCNAGSSNADAEALLKSVPAESSAVAVINVESLLSKMGAQYEDGRILLPSELREALDADALKEIDTQIGVKPTVLVAFVYRNELAVTGFVENKEAFKSFVAEKINKGSDGWEAGDDGAEICDDFVVKGDRFWAFTKRAFTNKVNEWVSLKDNESAYSSNKLVAEMTYMDKDIRYCCDVDRLMALSGGADLEQKMAMNMIREMLVVDMAYQCGWVDFGKDEISAEMSCYNSKFGSAEYVFDLEKINTDLLEQMPSNSNAVIALGTSSKMWKSLVVSLSDVAKNFVKGAELGIVNKVLDALNGLDGTFMVAADINQHTPNIKAVMQTQDEMAARSVVSLVNTFVPEIPSEMSLWADEKSVIFSMGEFVDVDRSDLKDKFNGNILYIYFEGSAFVGMNSNLDFIKSLEIYTDKMDCMKAKLQIANSGYGNILECLIMKTVKAEQNRKSAIDSYENVVEGDTIW